MTACMAPSASLYLDPRGEVRACCWNVLHPLGNITRKSLLEIWHGDAARQLRRAVRNHDLSLGCEACHGPETTVPARLFDRFRERTGEPDWPSQLELAMSNRCNLQCTMCNGDLSSAIRARRDHLAPLPLVYGDRFFEELRLFLPHLNRIKFLGGEPLLASETYRVWELLEELDLVTACHVTTNGTIWNHRVERVLRRFPVDVVVSLDGATATTFEAIRVGASHRQVLANLERFRSLAIERGTRVSLAHCLMTTNWHEFADFLLWAESIHLSVFVNSVDYPTHASLHRLPTEDLQTVVRALEARSGEVNRLPLNGSVWIEQVAELRRHLEDRPTGGSRMATSSSLRIERRGPLNEAADDLSLQLVRGQAGLDAQVHWVDADPGLLICAAGPEVVDVVGLDLSAMIGQPLGLLLQRLLEQRGPVINSTVERHDHGVELRVLTFGDDASSSITVGLSPRQGGDDGLRVYLTGPEPVGRLKGPA